MHVLQSVCDLANGGHDGLVALAAHGAQIATVRDFEGNTDECAVSKHTQRSKNARMNQTTQSVSVGLEAESQGSRPGRVGCSKYPERYFRAGAALGSGPDFGIAPPAQQARQSEAPRQFHARREFRHAIRPVA